MKTRLLLFVALTLLVACGPQTPTPGPNPVTVNISPDGGDYPSLEAAVEAVPEGSTIVLSVGTFVLDEPLRVTKSLILQGAGMDETEVVSDAEGYVVAFGGEGTFTAEGITFRHEGGAEADVMVIVGSGDVELTECRFVGATVTSEVVAHAGLRFQGSTGGTVRECEVSGNAEYGILVEGDAQPLLEENISTGNAGAGIAYYANGGGTARGNECTDNGVGIYVVEDAAPVLEENICSGNSIYGIHYLGNDGGTARGNECSENQEIGIRVASYSRPILEENTCSNNGETGIAFEGDSGGEARQNECRGNQGGMRVVDRAHPTLERNILAENVVVGLAYGGTAGGVARENECFGNDAGVILGGEAAPELLDNNIHDNITEGVVDLR